MITIERAYQLRALVEQAAVSLDDQAASTGAELFPRMKGEGALVSAGTRINWHGVIKRAAVDLWDTEENNPDHAPTLWDDIEYRDGLRVLTGPIPATNPVQVDEICWYKGERWKNVSGIQSAYLPNEYPAGWERME